MTEHEVPPAVCFPSKQSCGASVLWEDVEDRLCCLVENDVSHMQALESLHTKGLRQATLLYSLAYLFRYKDEVSCDRSLYWPALFHLANYLETRHWRRKELKASALRVLVAVRCQSTWSDWIESFMQDPVGWLLHAQEETLIHDETCATRLLLRDLRTLMVLQDNRARRFMIANQNRVRQVGNVSAGCISHAALLVRDVLQFGTGLVTDTLDQTGDLVCRQLGDPVQEDLLSPRAAVVARTYTDAAHRVTQKTRLTTQKAVESVKDASTQGLEKVFTQMQNNQAIEEWVPGESYSRVCLESACQVCVASVGAMAVVGDSVLTCTGRVCRAACLVTADICEHCYGPATGQCVRNIGDATGHVLKTMPLSAMVQAKVWTALVVKNAAKVQVEKSRAAT